MKKESVMRYAWALATLLFVAPGVMASAESEIRSSLKKHFPDLQVQSVSPSPIKGLYEFTAGPIVAYASEDGDYLLQGELVALNEGENLTDTARIAARQQAVSNVLLSNKVTFKAPEEQYSITIFTDIDCGYCRKLHNDIPELNAKGITVHYLAFPRAGVGSESYEKAVNVWCAEDKPEAMTLAKTGNAVDSKHCDHPVKEQFELGNALGVNGTPTIILKDGRIIPGYVSPDKLLEILAQ